MLKPILTLKFADNVGDSDSWVYDKLPAFDVPAPSGLLGGLARTFLEKKLLGAQLQIEGDETLTADSGASTFTLDSHVEVAPEMLTEFIPASHRSFDLKDTLSAQAGAIYTEVSGGRTSVKVIGIMSFIQVPAAGAATTA